MPKKPPDGFVDLWAAWRLQKRTSTKTGKVSVKGYRVDFEVPDLVFNADAKAYNALYADAIRDLVKQQIRNPKTAGKVQDATVRRRERYARNRGSRSYKRRYAGGKTGETPPAPAVGRVPWRYAVDSGRLVDNIVVRLRNRKSTGRSVATLNTVANRFDPVKFGDAAAFDRFAVELIKMAPILAGHLSGDAATALQRMTRTFNAVAYAKGRAELARLEQRLRRARLALLREALNLAVSVGG